MIKSDENKERVLFPAKLAVWSQMDLINVGDKLDEWIIKQSAK
jgi:hypothetical protein